MVPGTEFEPKTVRTGGLEVAAAVNGRKVRYIFIEHENTRQEQDNELDHRCTPKSLDYKVHPSSFLDVLRRRRSG